MKKFDVILESLIFKSRWILAPFFLGLIVAIISLLVKFAKELINLTVNVLSLSGDETIISILTLVDTTLIASLLLIIIFSGYENFVSKIHFGEHEDRPVWMGKIGFSDLKLKLIGAIVAISAVELLKGFINIHQYANEDLAWKVGIHIAFVISGVLFAVTDLIAGKKGEGH
ncbi:MAG: TIGR00645 family protein [Nitrospirota bacterium]|nr:TIGR00645 family protein [Nitrospirota bacterium]